MFVNPFDAAISIQPSLDTHGLPSGVFTLLTKTRSLQLAPRGEAKIGYTFAPQRMADQILGMGDMIGLIEKAEAAFDQATAQKTAERMMKGQFTLEDWLEQMKQMKKTM